MTFEEFAKEQGLRVEATAIPFRPDREELDDSPEHERLVHFLAVVRKPNGEVVWQGYYSMGTYHAIEWAKAMLQDEKSKAKLDHLLLKHSRGSPDKATIRDVEKLDSGFGWTDHDRKVARVIRRAFAEVAQVPVGDLLECLAYEWRSVFSTDCFEDWAEAHGYNPDSISALETYLKICQDRAKAKRVLGTAWETLMQIKEE